MRISHVLVAISFLFVGVLLGMETDSAQPGTTTNNLQVVVPAPSSTQSSKPTPKVNASDTPEQTLLKAIDLMKAKPKRTATPAALQLAAQLEIGGYYYWTTYAEGTERINFEGGDATTVKDDIEFMINPEGRVVSAASFGPRHTWSTFCSASPSDPSSMETINRLLNRTRGAAKRLRADKGCVYNIYEK